MSSHHGRGLRGPGTQRGTGGTLPPSRGSSRISASRASCRDSPSPVLRRGQQARHQAEGHGVAYLTRPQQVAQRLAGRSGAARGPVEDGVGEGVPGQRAEVRDPGEQLGLAVHARTLAASMTGSVRPRCAAATAPNAWSRVSTPAGAGGQPAGGAAARSPVAISRSPADAISAGSMPVAAKRCRTASHGSGVRSRCHSRWLSTPVPRSSSGRSVSTTSHWSRSRPVSASRTASADTHGTTRTGTSSCLNSCAPAHSGRARTPRTPDR